MKEPEINSAIAFNAAEIIDYMPCSVVIKSIICKTTGNVSVTAFDTGELFAGKVTPFDSFIQVIEGKAEILIDDHSHLLETGQSIIIPAHSRNMIRARGRFKMVTTTIKSGYEEVS